MAPPSVQHHSSGASVSASSNNPENTQATPNASKEEVELQKFVSLFQESASTSTSTSKSTIIKPGSEERNKSWSLLSFLSSARPEESVGNMPTADKPLDPISESILPTTMSCRTSFDLAFHCQSLGGQWTSLYRNGELRSCSTLWSDFWFCIRVRSYGEGSIIKENAIRDHYRHRIREKYYTPNARNSEEVWEARTEKLPREQVFIQKLE